MVINRDRHIDICHAVIALLVVLLILLSSLQSMDLNLECAALSLGAGPVQLFMKVVIPLAAPGLISAALLAFLTFRWKSSRPSLRSAPS